jgi:hypothetical protein
MSNKQRHNSEHYKTGGSFSNASNGNGNNNILNINQNMNLISGSI